MAQKFVQNFKTRGNYREFIPLSQHTPPYSHYNGKKIINWCNNDYNGLMKNYNVMRAIIEAIKRDGCGAGGTRNIGGTHVAHEALEQKIAQHHGKERGLLFNSGFLANLSAIQAFGQIYPNAELFSDADNHASIINGVQLSKLPKKIFKHNDVDHLDYLVKNSAAPHKIILTEGIFSMDGSIAELKGIVDVAKRRDCMTFVDEIHAVGVHGKTGAGATEHFGLSDNVDVIMGGFGKGYGIVGGYLTGDNDVIDAIRMSGSGFIFTTAIPPMIAVGIQESIDQSKVNIAVKQQQRKEKVKYFRQLCAERSIPLMENNFEDSHIFSVLIGNSTRCTAIHKLLLDQHNQYIQPINYPTVPWGTERLRISIKEYHNCEMIKNLVNSIDKSIKSLHEM